MDCGVPEEPNGKMEDRDKRWELSMCFKKDISYSDIRPYLDEVVNRCEDIGVYLHGLTIRTYDYTGYPEDRYYETLPNEDEVNPTNRISLYLDVDKPKRSIIKKFKSFILPNRTPYEGGDFNDDY